MINLIENVKLDKQDKNSLSIALAHSLEQTLKRYSLLSGLNKRINSKKKLKNSPVLEPKNNWICLQHIFNLL